MKDSVNDSSAKRNQVVRALWAKERFDRLAEGLCEQKLGMVPWKGALFQRLLYDDITERPITDLDPLVSPEALEPASQVLMEMGFHPIHTPLFRFSFTARNQTVFGRGSEPRIELHTAVGPDPRCFDVARRWVLQPSDPRVPKTLFESPNVVVPRLEEILAGLVVHYRDDVMGISWYQREDIRRLVERFTLRVPDFVRACSELRCVLAAAVCLDDVYSCMEKPEFVRQSLKQLPLPAHAGGVRRLLALWNYREAIAEKRGISRTTANLGSHAILLQDHPKASWDLYRAQIHHILSEGYKVRQEGQSLADVILRVLRLKVESPSNEDNL